MAVWSWPGPGSCDPLRRSSAQSAAKGVAARVSRPKAHGRERRRRAVQAGIRAAGHDRQVRLCRPGDAAGDRAAGHARFAGGELSARLPGDGGHAGR
jgi:hypothetical protein